MEELNNRRRSLVTKDWRVFAIPDNTVLADIRASAKFLINTKCTFH